MAAQNETMAEVAKALSRGPAKITLSKFGDPNMTSFKNMVNYLSSLRDAGVLNNDGFASLLLYTCSIFIENEVEERVSKIFANKLQQLQLFS
jgi:hypothetical protein